MKNWMDRQRTKVVYEFRRRTKEGATSLKHRELKCGEPELCRDQREREIFSITQLETELLEYRVKTRVKRVISFFSLYKSP